MFASPAQVLEVARVVFPEGLPRGFAKLDAALQRPSDAELRTLARSVHTTARRLAAIRDSADPVKEAVGVDIGDVTEVHRERARLILGQLLLGTLAERAFEELYETEMGSELKLEDERAGYTETDYRILNGDDRPVFRLNIKFHGTPFANAMQLVGLEPEDCFALATYKIHQAVERETREVLPYVFAIVSVPGLTTGLAGEIIPDQFVDLAALTSRSTLSGKRAVEDRIVQHILQLDDEAVHTSVVAFSERIRTAQWRMISATKAQRLLLSKLFDRVYAVRVRAFARNYRNAEVDMHFSLRDDLTPVEAFLQLVRDRGLHGVTAHLSSGVI